MATRAIEVTFIGPIWLGPSMLPGMAFQQKKSGIRYWARAISCIKVALSGSANMPKETAEKAVRQLRE